MLTVSTRLTSNEYIINDFEDLLKRTMLGEHKSNICVYFDTKKHHLYVEFIGYVDTPFVGGRYIIEFDLPDTYPLKPPGIKVLTESGRFVVDRHLSFSISHYHPDTWYQMSMEFLIIATVSSFPEQLYGIGHLKIKEDICKQYALKSIEYNKQHRPDLTEIFDKIRVIKDSNDEQTINDYIKTTIDQMKHDLAIPDTREEELENNKNKEYSRNDNLILDNI